MTDALVVHGAVSVDEIAAAVIRVLEQSGQQDARAEGWIGAEEAAAYLGITVAALDKLTAARKVAFSQERDGGKRWFRRSDLDAFREANLQPADGGV